MTVAANDAATIERHHECVVRLVFAAFAAIVSEMTAAPKRAASRRDG
jgi:hypothetical protein